jgi:hypothetical protein
MKAQWIKGASAWGGGGGVELQSFWVLSIATQFSPTQATHIITKTTCPH